MNKGYTRREQIKKCDSFNAAFLIAYFILKYRCLKTEFHSLIIILNY